MYFIGLDTQYPTAEGKVTRRVHLDGAASPLASSLLLETYAELLPHYSNSHSYVHNSARISTDAFHWAHDTVLNCLQANPEDYACIFSGSGCTDPINRLARGLAERQRERPIVLISAMEHHGNDLPHRLKGNEIVYIPLTGEGPNLGQIDLEWLADYLHVNGQKVNYLAVSTISNVTGIANDIKEIVKLSHAVGSYVIVDAAQSIAHQPHSDLFDDDVKTDFLVFSGHKLYAPSTPGVLIARKNLMAEMSGQNLGGGSVLDVSPFDYQLSEELPEREQSGTPNLMGAVALARIFSALVAEDLAKVESKEQGLMDYLVSNIQQRDFLQWYGDPSLSRLGATAFNHRDLDHGLFAAMLNDYHNIALRNECFCAHPYVSALLKQELWEIDIDDMSEHDLNDMVDRRRGMVRASISHYTSKADIDALFKAIDDVHENSAARKSEYDYLGRGVYQHRTHRVKFDIGRT
ncbi:MAG: aminotransferase class V-fold PLP-dependent enzyme [Pseudomonadota bacterium]